MPNQPTHVVESDVEDLDLNEEPREAQALAVRAPAGPATVIDLAAQRHYVERATAIGVVVATMRAQSLLQTHPEDWVMFKAPEEHGGQIVCYLQDNGCDRVRPIWGIEIHHVSEPKKIEAADGSFMYIITGDGRCSTSGTSVERAEGGRSSTDEFCRGKTGSDLEMAVRKAARANLDGNIVRELAGLAAVPLDELQRVWQGTHKRVEQCRRGRGFGSHSERIGGRSEKAPDVDPPICAVCGKTGVYREGRNGRGAFYGCPGYQQHADKKWTVDAKDWEAQQKAAAKAAPPPEAAGPPLHGDEIFGKGPR
jgi:hypothetical protein